MGKHSETPADGRLVEYFHRHVIPIYFDLKKDNNHHCFIITSFVMSVYNQWFLVTAGHCIEDIEKLLNAGYQISKCRLIDSMGTGALHRDPIPFDYEDSGATKMCYDPKYDYGLIFLSDHYVDLLRSNKVVPMTEEVWEKQPSKPDFFALIGIPEELSDSSVDIAHVASTFHIVEEYPRRPAFFENTEAPTFFGKISLPESMTTIAGMSGGPILSFKRSESGHHKYWLHAVQSRWIKSEKAVAACLMRPLGIFLKEFMEGKHHALTKNK